MRQKRHLELEGAYNIRDLGGYPTVDGQTTRWGTVLRGDNMHRLPSESQAALIDYGVRTVIDLRKDYELEQMPNVFAGSSAVDYHHQDMLGDTGTIESAERPSSDEMWSSIAINYVHFLEERRPQVGETLATLAATGALPGIFHCAAGKDRTGLIAALLLGIAGVPANTIAEDYTL